MLPSMSGLPAAVAGERMASTRPRRPYGIAARRSPRPEPGSVRVRLMLSLGLAWALALLSLPGWSAEGLTRDLKVVYLYNFTRYVDWPDDSIGDAFVISVVGDADMAEALRALERSDKRAEGRPIRVRELPATGDINDAQILFVGAAARSELPRILARTRGKPILLVGDSPGLAAQGVAINFFLRPDILGAGEQLRFQIHPAALNGRALKVMADLYDVAEIVR